MAKTLWITDGYTEDFRVPLSGGGAISGTFRPLTGPRAAYTQSKLTTPNVDLKKVFEVCCGALVEVIKSWDVLDEQGQPVPVTLESLQHLRAGAVEALYQTLVDDEALSKQLDSDVKN